MEILVCFVLLLTRKFHRLGFSNIEFDHCRSVYFYSNHENLEIYIDGRATGVMAPAMLYFPEDEVRLLVEYKNQNLCFFKQTVELIHEKTLVMANITPVINMFA
jgi:hypothetical protein